MKNNRTHEWLGSTKLRTINLTITNTFLTLVWHSSMGVISFAVLDLNFDTLKLISLMKFIGEDGIPN
jgi:hypothetical protein